MNKQRPVTHVIGVLILLSLILAQAVRGQGLYWEQTATVTVMGKPQEAQTKGYLKPMKLKTISDDGSGAIIRSDKEMFYTINTKEKTYSEMTFKEFEGQITKAGEQMKQMQEQFKNLPPEQRKMMEGMMGGSVGGEKEYELKKTSGKKKVAGYSCEKILLYEGDKELGEFWLTKDIGSMKDYAKDWSKMMDKLVQGPFAKMFRKLAELDGFVMESKFSGMTTTTTKLEKRSVNDSEFEVPAGYKKKEMEDMGGED